MLEFIHRDRAYRARKLDTFKQMHVLKRVGPALLELRTAIAEAATAGDTSDLIAGFALLMKVLHSMSDDELDFVTKTCMAVVQRQQGSNGSGVWAPIFEPRSSQFMFDDIDLGSMLEITVHVIQDNLGGFFSTSSPVNGPPAESPAPPLNG